MNSIHVIATLSALALTACTGVESEEIVSGDEAVEPQAEASREASDPLGIDLAAVGLSAGDRPCGDDAHVASVVDEAGRYLAFCVSPRGSTAVLQVTPGNVEPLRFTSRCALDTYLATTPAEAAVPRALAEACKGSPLAGRALSAGPVAVGSTAHMLGGPVLSGATSCSSAAVFEDIHCAAIEDFAAHEQVADAVTWCGLGPFTGTSQRTASSQGIPDAFQGRVTVAACGTQVTNLRGLVKKSISNAWVTVTNVNINPYYGATRDIYLFDVEETVSGNTYYGEDLPFQVSATSGGWFRYTGTFVEFVPTP